MRKTLLTLLFCLFYGYIQAEYHGRIFVDSNQNGKYDSGEELLKNIMVSDGLNVTLTSKKGEYNLPGHAKERFIFITTPSGYKTNNQYYQRIEPGVELYDFGIVPFEGRVGKDGSHSFIHISDTEVGETMGHDEWIGNLREYAANEKSSFIVHTGDICYTAGLKSHIQLMNSENMGTQVFYCIGNHDLVQGKSGEEYFESLYGPTYYSFDMGNVHYIVTPMPNGDYRPSYTTNDIYQWLKNDLDKVGKEKSVVIFNHDLLDRSGLFHFGNSKTDYIDLKEHNLKAWLYGHWHINHIVEHPESGIYSICTSTPVRGGIDHASSAFRVMKMDGKGNFESELRYSYIDRSIAIASINNLQSPVLSKGGIPLSVNVYSTTSPTRKVEYTCSYNGKNIVTKKPMKQENDFNWNSEITIPKELAGRMIDIEVVASFGNGEIAKCTQSFVHRPEEVSKIATNQPSTNLLGTAAHAGSKNDTLKSPLQLQWIKNIGSNIYMTSPLLYENRLYVASIDENNLGKATVAALDAKTGELIWKHKVRGSIRNSIAITDDLLFAQDIYGYLYAINTASGTLIWEKKLEVNQIPALNDGLIASEGIVYAGTGYGLCALNAKDGKEIWKNKEWGQGEGCTATLSLHNNVVIGHSHWGALYANDASNGKLLWGRSENGLRHRSSSAAMMSGVMYILSDESLFVIESATGNVLFRKPLGYNVNVTSTPLVTDNEIIFGTATKGIVALDRETMAEKWNFVTNPAMIYSAPYVRNPSSTVETSPVLCGNTIYVAASDGIIYGIDKTAGKLLWKHSTGAPLFATVTVSGNALFAVDFAGNIYGFAAIRD